MFRRKKAQEEEKRAKERLARKLLGQDIRRKQICFRCADWIQSKIKELADANHVTMASLAEHALELGMIQIKEAVKDPEEREELRSHLAEDHIGERTVEKVARYDKEASEDLRIERLRRFEIDKNVRRLVVKYGRWFKPDQLEEFIDLGNLTKVAIAAGWPPPPQLSRTGNARPRPTGYRRDESSASDRSSEAKSDPGPEENQTS